MIGPFLGVTLVPQVEVRNIMIPIFHDMMDWEQRKNGNFKQVPGRDPPIRRVNRRGSRSDQVCVPAGGGRADRQAGQLGF